MVKLVFRELVHVVFHEGYIAQQVIQRNVEEALNLGGVQIHGQDPVSAGGGEHIGNQFCGDGVPGLGFTVLPGVTEVGDNGGNPACGCTAAGIDHYQQFHQMVIDGLAGGLNQEYVGATNGFFQGDGSFTIGEMLHRGLSHFDAQLFADGLSKLRVGVAAENLNVFTVCNHRMNTSL